MAKIDYSDKQVLLIESSGNMRSTIFYMLRSLGVVNLKAITINDRVLSEIAEVDYDVILLGHNVSDSVTGIQLLEECRYRGYIKPSACWVFMSSDASQEVVLHAIDSHPDDLIMKPFSVDELKHRLDNILYRKSVFQPVDEAIEIGDLPSAINFCKHNFAPYDLEYDEAQLILARLLIQFRRPAEAASVAEKQYWKSHNKEAGLLWAEALLALKKPKKAKALLQELIEEYPLFIASYDLLVRAHESSGDLEKAREVMAEATQKSPMGIPRQMELGRLATQTQKLDLAGGAYKKSIVLGRRSCHRSAEPYLRLANVKRLEMKHSAGLVTNELQGEFEKVLAQANQAFPNDKALQVRSALLKSELYQQQGDIEQASKCTRDAQRLNDELEQPLDLDRELLSVTGDAVPILEEESVRSEPVTARTHDPEMSLKVNRLGVKHYLSGKMPQALKYFGLATEYDASNAGALLNLAQLFLESARDSREKRQERLKMVERYLALASRLPLEDVEKDKQSQLKRYLGHDPALLPQGSLGNLLR
ncbi:response regulator [Neptuniibacter halophilus]|uniref:response regulator n=1 Tax=Neptuniibacter halophilus TaxID=651666 RepID=UPI0025737145|nr:response regulator [Neptuniibacter halophilus]